MIDNWIICLIHCWKLWFCEHLQKQTKERSYCTLWSKNFGNPRLRWKLILLDGHFNLAFLSTKKLEFYWLKSAVLILTALFSLFCRINKLKQWNNIFFNLCNITYLYKLLNLNYDHFWPNTSHFKIICFFWIIKSGPTISWKMKIISYSLNISKNKNPRKFWICVFERGYPWIHF